MSIDGTLKLITESTGFISTGDIVAIVVAVVSLIGVILSTVFTNRTTKKINNANTELQEKWNQKNIDASLTASARIEWIQKVRNTTAELLGHYFDILNTVDSVKIEDALINSQQKTELLALYFGPEIHEQSVSSEDNNILLNTENNDGKNDVIVLFITNLAQRFSDYSIGAKRDRFHHLQQAVQNARNEAYKNATQKVIGYSYTEEGDEVPEYDLEWQDEDEASVINAEVALREETKRIKGLRDDLMFLRNVMRIYLKLEWNKAKIGA